MKCQVISCLSAASGGGWTAVHAGDPGHSRDSKSRLFVPLSLSKHRVCVPVSLTTCLSAGAVHSDERPVHEERPGLRSGLLHHGPVDLQRPPGPQRADPQSEGHRGCTAHTENPDVTSCSTERQMTTHLWRKSSSSIVSELT